MITMTSSAPPADSHGYALHPVGPVGPEALAVRADDPRAVLGQVPLLLAAHHLGADEAQHGGQQRQGGHHGEGHADGGRHGQPVQEADAEGEHAEQRDAHDDPGEEDGPARGVDRVDDGGLRVAPGHEPLAVPGHDEEGVVDADAQPDEEHQLGGDRRHPDGVAEHADHADGGAQREQGRDDREDGGEDRAEDEQQHDQGEEHAEAGAAERLVVGVLGQLPGDRDRQPVARRLGHRVDELLGFGVRDVVGLLVERDLEEPDRPVRVDVRSC